MENLVTVAKDFGTDIKTFVDAAAQVRTDVLAWLANNERVPEKSLASILQLRILVKTLETDDQKLAHEYGLVADQAAFKTDGLKQSAEQLNYGPIAGSAQRIAVATISRRGFPHYVKEVSHLVSALDEKLRESEAGIEIWNRDIGNRSAESDIHLALDGACQQAEAFQGFVLTGMTVITAVAEAQTADA